MKWRYYDGDRHSRRVKIIYETFPTAPFSGTRVQETATSVAIKVTRRMEFHLDATGEYVTDQSLVATGGCALAVLRRPLGTRTVLAVTLRGNRKAQQRWTPMKKNWRCRRR
jgi:hypothetical protein